MAAHQKKFGKHSEKVKSWTAALCDIANKNGHHIHTGSENDHIKEIVEMVQSTVPPRPLLVGETPVELDQHIEEIRHQFEAASCLANVRKKWKITNGPEYLQKTLLSEMHEQPETEWGSTSKGIYEIKHKLERKKVLLVLDDVDNIEQLKNLAGGSDWFGPGSRIIVTTKDKGLFKGTLPIKVQNIYEMTQLNDPKTGSSRAIIGYAKSLQAIKSIRSNLPTRKKSGNKH